MRRVYIGRTKYDGREITGDSLEIDGQLVMIHNGRWREVVDPDSVYEIIEEPITGDGNDGDGIERSAGLASNDS